MNSDRNPEELIPALEPATSFADSDQIRWVQSALGIVTWVWMLETNEVRWFGDLSALLGLPPGRFAGTFRDYLNYVHPDDVKLVRQNFIECIKGRRPFFRNEERVLWSDGSIRWLEIYGRAETHPGGGVRRILGVIRDVSDRKEIENALVKSEELFAKVFRSSPAAILVTRLSDGLILNANPHFEEITAYEASDVIGRTTSEIGLWCDPVDRDRWIEQLAKRGLVRDYPTRFNTKDGRIIQVLMSTARLNLEGEAGAISLSRDVTEQAQTQRKAIESQRKYATVFEICPEAMAITRVDGGAIIEVNSAFVKKMGRSREETLGRSGTAVGIWAREADRNHVLERVQQDGAVSNYETQFVHANGTTHDILLSVSPLEFEEHPCLVWAWRDVTEIRAAERKRADNERRHREELLRLANEDRLTGLPNRNWLTDQLARAVQSAREEASRFAILFIDFDGFKRINDSIGHAIGDELLKEASRRIERTLRACDRVARIGGDEFTVLMHQLDDESDVVGLAHQLVRAFDQPFQLSNHELRIGISIGISLYPKDGTNGDALLRSADIAMYEAKASGRGRYHFYTDVLFQRLTQRLETERALDQALGADELFLHYQPRIASEDGRLVGFEALLRWDHPSLGLQYPSNFIALAEETGLIVRIGERVIDMVCAQLALWTKAGLAIVPVSLNISPQEFQRTELAPCIAAALARHGVSPALLEIEITESSTLAPHFDAPRRLAELHTLGLKVLIDDFGTGYSSLSQLQKLDVDVLKIDRSFTAELGASRHGEVLVRTIVAMAKALDMIVVAEGVETLEQFQMLRLLGCDEMQGYLISRPMPASAVPTVLNRTFLPGTTF